MTLTSLPRVDPLRHVAISRLGTLMEPDPTSELEAEGVLNPGSAWGVDGVLRLYPRLVAAGNRSRIGRARIRIVDGLPVGVEREGIALEAQLPWERGVHHGGVEDPRTTWIQSLERHVMTYVAFGPFGPRPAVAVSADGIAWTRLGPLHLEYDERWGVDFDLFPNKDVVFFPEPVRGPDGRTSFALLHRPMWDFGFVAPHERAEPPAGIEDLRPGIWISFVPVDEARADLRALTRARNHRPVAQPALPWEQLKIGAGPAPLLTDAGWLVIHHGVSGRLEGGAFDLQQHVRYAAGALLLDADDPTRLIARSHEPLLAPDLEDEREGAVANVVFPTSVESIDGTRYIFYGMADSRIGVARLDIAGGSSGGEAAPRG